jgi:hypothetical protein
MKNSIPDFKKFCAAACVKLWGKPDRTTPKELRWNGGDSYSARTFNPRKNVWFDAGQKRGGSTLELARYAKGKPALKKGTLRGALFLEAWTDAFDLGYVPDPPPAKSNGKSNGKSTNAIRAVYPYEDENRVLLFQVLRFDTDDPLERFRQRQPDGKGGWQWDIKGVRRVLYRLPELIAATKAGERVLLCEGERDVGTAVKLGYAATTMPGGVDKWQKEFDEFLRGADLVIVSDNDEQLVKDGKPQFHPDGRPVLPGQDHAAKMARRLARVAASVRVILPPVKDLTQWIETGGGTREALDALIAQAPDRVKQPPEPEPEPAEDDEPTEGEAQQLLAELNRDNAVVLDGARTRVLRFVRVTYNAGGERYSYDEPMFLHFDDFKGFYLNRRIRVNDDRTMTVGTWWLGHRQRRQYDGLVFEPRLPEIVFGKLNLWRGWGVAPKEDDWSLMRQHIKEVLCAGDEKVDTYTMNWLAWSVQNPDQQPEAALVFLGDRGTGKGTLGKALVRIFGQHARHISSADHLTGHFNAHLRECAFLFADEAYAPKDVRAQGTLNRMITEPTLTIEGKGRDLVTVPNCLHVMLASNNDWVVPAGMHERRYVVQKVSDSKRQDRTWFGPLYQQLQNGGLGAMLYDLLQIDLGDWHPRQVVSTAALAEQQLQSLSALDEWWLDILHTGVLVGAAIYEPHRAVSNSYEEDVTETGSDGFGGRRTHTRRVRRRGLFDAARASSPRLRGVSDHMLGHYLIAKGAERAWVNRRRGWELPPLAQCRDAWCKDFPDTEWQDRGETEWQAEPED